MGMLNLSRLYKLTANTYQADYCAVAFPQGRLSCCQKSLAAIEILHPFIIALDVPLASIA